MLFRVELRLQPFDDLLASDYGNRTVQISRCLLSVNLKDDKQTNVKSDKIIKFETDKKKICIKIIKGEEKRSGVELW